MVYHHLIFYIISLYGSGLKYHTWHVATLRLSFANKPVKAGQLELEGVCVVSYPEFSVFTNLH